MASSSRDIPIGIQVKCPKCGLVTKVTEDHLHLVLDLAPAADPPKSPPPVADTEPPEVEAVDVEPVESPKKRPAANMRAAGDDAPLPARRRAPAIDDDDDDLPRSRRRDDDDDDRPRSKKTKKKKKPGSPVRILVGAFAVLIIAGMATAGIYFGFIHYKKDSPGTVASGPSGDGGGILAPSLPDDDDDDSPHHPGGAGQQSIDLKWEPHPYPLRLPPRNDPAPPPVALGPGNGLVPEILNKVRESTVFIKVDRRRAHSTGSGFVATPDGLIVTNAHVVGMLGANAQKPTGIEVIAHGGEQDKEFSMKASIVALDRVNDLCVLRVKTPAGKKLPPPMPIVSASHLAATNPLFVSGFPLGEKLGREVTVGPLSVAAMRKDSDGALERIQGQGNMQPGNSGGPVVDSGGRVVGVAVAIIRDTSINFAIPGEKVLAILEGRLTGILIGEPIRESDRQRIDVTVHALDPRSAIKEVAVDWWFDSPDAVPIGAVTDGPPPSSNTNRQTVKIPLGKLEGDKRTGKGELSLPIATPTDKALWVQARIVNGTGKTVAYRGISRDIESFSESKPVTLTRRPQTGSDRVTLRSILTMDLMGDEQENRNIKFDITSSVNERTQSVSPDGRSQIRVDVDKFNLNVIVNERPAAIPDPQRRMLAEMNKLGIVMFYGPTGELLNSRHEYSDVKGNTSRMALDQFANQIADSLDLGAIPMPGEVKPGQTWAAKRKFSVTHIEGHSTGNADITYTYLGVRQYNGREVAVCTMTGGLSGLGGWNMKGQMNGSALIDVANGKVVKMNARLDFASLMQIGPIQLNATAHFDVKLARRN
jgi:S1-C subfamily serine protease